MEELSSLLISHKTTMSKKLCIKARVCGCVFCTVHLLQSLMQSGIV